MNMLHLFDVSTITDSVIFIHCFALSSLYVISVFSTINLGILIDNI